MSYFLFLYFIAGVVQDFFFTLNMRFTAKGKAFYAGVFAALEILMIMLVFYNILSGLDEERSIVSIIVYAFGIGVGSYLGVKFNLKNLAIHRHDEHKPNME